ncbi:MAG: response regulator [Nitrospirae bacterium]|nr:response regulator [Nitrospirota bacterium]
MGKKILVADSDSVVLQVVSYFLKLEGFEVEVVGDGVSAMEAIEKISPDVIIMSPDLPGLNGVEVSQFIKEKPQYKAIPIIFLSESDEPLLNNIPDLYEKFGTVNKPIDPTKLVNTVNEFIEKRPDPSAESISADDVVKSLKSIEELLGWDIPDKRLLHKTEEYHQDRSVKGTFDITEMLSGIINVPDNGTEVSLTTHPADETPGYQHELVSGSYEEGIPKQSRDELDDDRQTGFSRQAPVNPWPANDYETPVCHPEFVSGSFGKGVSKLVRDEDWNGREGLSVGRSMVCEMTTHDENHVRYAEPVTGTQTMHGQESPQQVWDDSEGMVCSEVVVNSEEIEYKEKDEHRNDRVENNSRAEEFYDPINESAVSEPDEAADVEVGLKSRITDEMIENMVRKIAVDVVERVARELVPDIAEREIIKEIERLKGTE